MTLCSWQDVEIQLLTNSLSLRLSVCPFLSHSLPQPHPQPQHTLKEVQFTLLTKTLFVGKTGGTIQRRPSHLYDNRPEGSPRACTHRRTHGAVVCLISVSRCYSISGTRNNVRAFRNFFFFLLRYTDGLPFRFLRTFAFRNLANTEILFCL